MSTFIHNNKIYDTEAATCVASYTRQVGVINTVFGDMPIRHNFKLYKTKKKNWFTVRADASDREHFDSVTENEARKIICELNMPEVYSEHFEELEEA